MRLNVFDIVVVGSSPLLMLLALQAKRSGNAVCVVEQSQALGGAWALGRYALGGSALVHENACHLVEWYFGAYELLERLSGVEFVLLSPQPVRVSKGGRITPYTSRAGMVIDYLLSWRTLSYAIVKLVLSYAEVRKYPRNNAWYGLGRALAKVVMDTKYRLRGIRRFDGVRAPKYGFAHFVSHLTDQLSNHGVAVVRGQAQSISCDRTGAIVSIVGAEPLHARAVAVGESSVLPLLDGNLRAGSKFTEYHHVLVSLPASDTLIRNSYIHFPDHDIFHRMTYVTDTIDGQGTSVSIFLVQLRIPAVASIDLRAEFQKVCDHYRIATTAERLNILRTIEAAHISSSFDSDWRLFAGDAPLVLRTIGDLSRNVLLMRNKLTEWS